MNCTPKVRQKTLEVHYYEQTFISREASYSFSSNQGNPIKRLSKDSHIHEGMILEWVRKYDLFGESGLQKQPNIRATSDFKEEVVRL
ncbi:hypothetical protein EZS27_042397, partial [termite gut metagenome]